MKTISMYSYKGGSGRSTACVNLIYFLADTLQVTEKNPIIVVDTDIDSAGLSFLLNSENKKVNLYLQDVLNGENKGKNVFGEIEDNPFFASLLAVGKYFKLPERAVLLLPSKVKSDSNVFDLSSKTLVEFKAIKKLSERYKCSAVVYDCPSGTQLLAEWSISESDNVVCCLRPTYQFIRGTVESVTSMSLTSANPKLPKKNFIICPNAVSRKQNVFRGLQFPECIRDTLQNQVIGAIKENLSNAGVEGHNIIDSLLRDSPEEFKKGRPEHLRNEQIIGIPEVERFKWFETCLGVLEQDKLIDDERLAVERYKYLASLIK